VVTALFPESESGFIQKSGQHLGLSQISAKFEKMAGFQQQPEPKFDPVLLNSQLGVLSVKQVFNLCDIDSSLSEYIVIPLQRASRSKNTRCCRKMLVAYYPVSTFNKKARIACFVFHSDACI